MPELTHPRSRLIRVGVASIALAALAALTSCSTADDPSPTSDGRAGRSATVVETTPPTGTTSAPTADPSVEPTADPDDSPYAGLNPADVRDIIARDQGDYADDAAKTAAIQQVALGWHACRGVYEVYDEWVRTGKLRPKPTLPKAKVAKSALKGNRQWIDALYAPLADDDRKLARQQLESDYNCGLVPVAEQGDRSLSIGDALSRG